MQNPEGGGIAKPEDRNNVYRAVVSDLVSLTEHVQASLRLIEHAIAREAIPGNQEADVIVLDDVTPPLVKATAALNACDANLATALHFVLDTNAPVYDRSNLGWSRSALSIVRA